MIRTDLILSITCKECDNTFFATVIYGGLSIDEDSTMTIAEAHIKGDKIQLSSGEKVRLGRCICENNEEVDGE